MKHKNGVDRRDSYKCNVCANRFYKNATILRRVRSEDRTKAYFAALISSGIAQEQYN